MYNAVNLGGYLSFNLPNDDNGSLCQSYLISLFQYAGLHRLVFIGSSNILGLWHHFICLVSCFFPYLVPFHWLVSFLEWHKSSLTKFNDSVNLQIINNS